MPLLTHRIDCLRQSILEFQTEVVLEP